MKGGKKVEGKGRRSSVGEGRARKKERRKKVDGRRKGERSRERGEETGRVRERGKS